MPEYTIPVMWTMWGTVTVTADSITDAINQAVDGNLPKKQNYMPDSCACDTDMLEHFNTLTESDLLEVASLPDSLTQG